MNLVHRNNAYFCVCLIITTLDTIEHNRKSEKLISQFKKDDTERSK